MMNPMSLSDRIHQRRAELGLSQKDLAGQIGVTQGAIAQFESGSRAPSLDLLPAVSKALRVSTDYLLTGSESEWLDIGSLNAADRLMLRRFYDYLVWLKGK